MEKTNKFPNIPRPEIPNWKWSDNDFWDLIVNSKSPDEFKNKWEEMHSNVQS